MTRQRKKVRIPEKGIPSKELLQNLSDFRDEDVNWKSGKAFGYVYHATDEIKELIRDSYDMFSSTNALNPMAFPSLKQFEAEIASMTADMLGGDTNAVGNVTSCGTESVILAVKTYWDWAHNKKGIKNPEMIVPESIHPSFNKGAHYFNVKTITIPLDDNFKLNVSDVENAINKNTMLIVGSACDYPRGMVDPIEKLAALAKDHKIGFHTDSCLGGFMLPWLKKLGYDIPEFDLSVDGVTSISADSHKYGYGAKGTSVLLFKDKSFQKHQYFCHLPWPGGVYAHPTMTGTRPGGVIAATWAAMRHIGEDGYLSLAKKAMETTQRLKDGINAIPEMHVLGKPDMTVFSFGSDTLNPYIIADAMQKRGWVLDRLQYPACLHVIVNPFHETVVDEFLTTLKEAVEE
ncbi:MAG: aspartate aminotransferase family protein, partial [archaeon]|nr:aspartate aminotransferase family protein [archaeon]